MLNLQTMYQIATNKISIFPMFYNNNRIKNNELKVKQNDKLEKRETLTWTDWTKIQKVCFIEGSKPY